jgi:hypothetical protein
MLEPDWDIPNGWHATQRVQLGPWYGEGDGDRRSCRQLEQCVTEFGAQGLELDAVLLALFRSLPVTVIACVIHKPALRDRYGALAVDPYSLSLGVVVERFCFALGEAGETGCIVAESRNGRIDRELTIAWDLLRLNGTRYVGAGTISRRIVGMDFIAKATGLAGLELADLAVSPIGRWIAGMRTSTPSS